MTILARVCLLAGGAAVLCATDSAAQSITFSPADLHPNHSPATGMATADFNRDGRMDFAVSDAGANRVYVFQASGNVFATGYYATDAAPAALVAADVNHDGAADLLTANSDASTFSVLINTGNGNFRPAVNIVTGAGPVGLVAADFNRDGDTDVVTLDAAANTLSIRLGTGDGSFGAIRTYVTAARPRAVLAADLNRDGKLDLIVANGDANSVSVRLGSGSGTFGAAVRYAAAGAATDVRAGDFNRDGILDLAVSTLNARVSVLRGSGSGSFGSRVDLATGGPARRVLAADFDLDGRIDLAALTEPAVVTVFKGSGDGGFAPGRNTPIGTAGDGIAASAFAAEDLTADSRPDLLIGAGSPGEEYWATRLVLLRNTTAVRAAGSVFRVGAIAPPVYATHQGPMRSPDLNRDGIPDLLTECDLLRGLGDGTLGRAASTPFADSCWGGALAVGDFNRDGRLDLALVDQYGEADRQLRVALGTTAGSFTSLPGVSLPSGGLLTAGDFDNDGRLDLVAASPDPDSGPLLFLRGRGTGTFDVRMADAEAHILTGVESADLNADGNLDLLLIHGFESTAIEVRLGRGDGTFGEAQWASTYGDDLTSLATADFNRDGRLDIAATDLGVVSVLLGRGDGTFTRYVMELADPPADMDVGRAIAAADFNRDGRVDLAIGIASATGATRGLLDVLHGTGDGSFIPAGRFAVPTRPQWLTVADFNRDGTSDIAAAGYDADAVVLLNAPRVTVTSPNTPANWGLGSVQAIEWSHTLGSGAPFRIEFSGDGGATWRVLAEVTSTGSTSSRYRWTVDATATTAARIRVVSTRDPADRDVSNVNFTIAAPFIAIVSPGTRVTWTIGNTYSVVWSHNLGVSATVRVDISRDGGLSWAHVATGVPHTGTSSSRFQWTVTGPATSDARLRVSWTSNPAVSGVTRSAVAIAPGAAP